MALQAFANVLLIIFIITVFIISMALLIFFIYFMYFDRKQRKHSILRNYPLLGRMRYFLEKIGPELRQYWFHGDSEGKPFSRDEYETIVRSAKYKQDEIGFGSKRDFDKPGYYVRNDMFPKLTEELKVDPDVISLTKKYVLVKDPLFTNRVEKSETDESLAYVLTDEEAVVIGANREKPFVTKGIIGMSGMSYGALGKNAITALSKGIDMAKASWMNTGEGGLSPYHLEGGADLIMQIGPGLFGVRDSEGNLDIDLIKETGEIEAVKAFEVKLAQGAKVRGGHIDGEKVTPEIADIRKLEPYKTIDSPNRFKQFSNVEEMMDFVSIIQNATGKPVGIKIVVGSVDSVIPLAKYMKETGQGPDFITVDGAEGGTGATYQDLADSVGLPLHLALPILHTTLKKFGVREQVKIIASGKQITPDRMVISLSMGADLINLARGFMIAVGCIQTLQCHTNTCPVGVATTNPDLQNALVVDEKKYRVANYITTLREGLFRLSAAAGLASPVHFEAKHVAYKDQANNIVPLTTMIDDIEKQIEKELQLQ